MAKPKKSRKLPKVVEPAPSPVFELILSIGGRMYSSSGSSQEEAVLSLPRPPKISSKGMLTIRKGNNTRQRVLLIPQIKRLFYPLAQKMLAKQLFIGL